MTHDPAATLREIADKVDRLRADLADHRTAIAHASAKRDAFREEAADLRRQLGEARSANGVEHLGLHRDLARMCAEVERLGRIVTLCCESFDGGETASDDLPSVLGAYMAMATERMAKDAAELRDLRAEIAALRAEKAPQPEPAAPERVMWADNRLYVDGVTRGYVAPTSGGGWGVFCNGGPDDLPDEPTARAVLLALVGEDPGVTVALSLRDSWTREDVDRARDAGLGWYIAPLLDAYADGSHGQQHTERAEVIRQWVAGGQGLMSLRVVEKSADDCPF